MNERVVYLHELDSVRNSAGEIYHAQRAMFEEIVSNGSKVVLSFNQLTDSRAFMSLIQDDRSYKWIRELFREGTLRVSLYGNVRTASQYVQNALNKCLESSNVFYFSALPLKSTETNLIGRMLESLKFDDITLLQEKYEENENELFADSDRGGKSVPMSRKDRVKFLTRYLEMILFISQERLAANPPKKQPGSKNFYTYMTAARKILSVSSNPSYIEAEKELARAESMIGDSIGEKVSDVYGKIQSLKSSEHENDEEAKKEIAALNKKMSPALNRSVWYKLLRKIYSENPSAYETLSIAEAAVDICYNIQVEDSVNNVLKHYHEDDPKDFAAEFLQRLSEYVNPGNGAVHKFLAAESEWEEPKLVKRWNEKRCSFFGLLKSAVIGAAIGAMIGAVLGVVFGLNFAAVPWTVAAAVIIAVLPKLLNNTDRISAVISPILTGCKLIQKGDLARWATAARVNESARKYTSGIVRAIIKWVYEKFIMTPRHKPAENELYEEVIARDKKSWQKERSMRAKMYAFIFVLEGFVWYWVNSFLDSVLGETGSAVGWLIFVLFFLGVNGLLSLVGIPEILDIIRNSITAAWDSVVTRHAPAGEAYTRKEKRKK